MVPFRFLWLLLFVETEAIPIQKANFTLQIDILYDRAFNNLSSPESAQFINTLEREVKMSFSLLHEFKILIYDNINVLKIILLYVCIPAWSPMQKSRTRRLQKCENHQIIVGFIFFVLFFSCFVFFIIEIELSTALIIHVCSDTIYFYFLIWFCFSSAEEEALSQKASLSITTKTMSHKSTLLTLSLNMCWPAS